MTLDTNPTIASLTLGGIGASSVLVINGKTLTITGNYLQDSGTLVMTGSSDIVAVGGHFTVNSSAINTSGLSDGTIKISGNFSQVGSSTDDFQPGASSNNTVELNGGGDQTISFGSTGTGTDNHFAHLRVNKLLGGVFVASDLTVVGNGLIFDTATPMAISADKTVTVAGFETNATATITSTNAGTDRFDFTVTGPIDVDGLNFGSAKTNGLHVTDAGSFTKFDNVTFTDAQSGARHMRVEQQSGSITFNNVSFDASFGGGFNVTLEDTNGGTDVKLHVVNIVGAGAGRNFEEEVNTAFINWGNEVDWINASGGTWNTASNWSTGSVPGASSDVFIVFSGSYTVTLDVSPTIASLTLGASGASAILSPNGQTLTITGDYVQDNGNLSMASPSDVVDVNGNYTVNGSDGITPTLSDGTIRIAGNFAQTGAGANDFHGVSNHTTEVDGTSDQGISFVNAINHFGHLKINKASGKVSVTTDMVIESNGLMLDTATTVEIAADKTVTAGGLSSPASVMPTITSTNPGVDRFNFDVLGGIDVDGLNFGSAKTNGLNVQSSASFTKFDNVTFTDALSGGRHMRIAQAGPVSISLNNVSFDSSFGIGSGFNVTLEDTNGGTDVKLHVVNPLGAGAGRQHEEEINTAFINWGNEVDWINASGGTWNTASNWSTGAVPTSSTDEVFIVLGGTYTVTLDTSPTIASLNLGGSSGPQILSMNGGTLTLNGASTINASGQFTQTGGTFTGAGNLTVDGTYNWQGTMSGSGITIVNGSLRACLKRVSEDDILWV